MANGFLPSKGSMELEDIGNEIFNELLRRSLFQDIRKDNYTDMVYCKMHDLVHDLACSVTVGECTAVKVDKEPNSFKGITRHLSLEIGYSSSRTNISNSVLSQISQPLLCTFLLIGPVGLHMIFSQLKLTYTNLECLRVLDLSWLGMHTLHVSIRNLKHLRYLNLSNWDRMKSLPGEAICCLRNLQVLKLNRCYNLERLPENMRKLTNLRHLGMEGCHMLRRMPIGMGNLICLRTLSKFVVEPKSGLGISELHRLDQLTGKLEIEGLEHVRNSKDANSANLMRKKNISELTLSWSEENNSSSTIEEDKEVASIGESLQPHSNMKRLYINYYTGLKFPSWMSRHTCLPNLVEIKIEGGRRCENLPSLGNLPLLESLEISRMDSLKCIGDEFFYGDHRHGLSFPALKKLKISGMPNLEDWSSSSSSKGGGGGGGVFPSLEVLMLDEYRNHLSPPSGCPRLKYLPELGSRNIKTVEIQHCDGLTSVSECLRHLTTLEDLVIGNCPELEFLPDDFKDLKSLRKLTFWKLRLMTCLPEGLQQVAGTLESLKISFCSGIMSLPEWMDKFTSLQSLNIYDCQNLKVLPEEMLRLTTLQTLEILGCWNFRRYCKETGEDWHTIFRRNGEKTRMKCINKNIITSCFSSSSGTN